MILRAENLYLAEIYNIGYRFSFIFKGYIDMRRETHNIISRLFSPTVISILLQTCYNTKKGRKNEF